MVGRYQLYNVHSMHGLACKQHPLGTKTVFKGKHKGSILVM